jgi:hypothetical protein
MIMDEQGMQAYSELIEQLLGCEQGKEEELLRTNGSLVDGVLVLMMGQVAELMESQGQGESVGFKL